MRPLPVVEDLDVFEDLAACALARLEGSVSDQLLLDGGEEALVSWLLHPSAAESRRNPGAKT